MCFLRSLDFAEKKTANLCEKCKSCTKEMSRLKARLSLLKKTKVKAKDDKRPSQKPWTAQLARFEEGEDAFQPCPRPHAAGQNGL